MVLTWEKFDYYKKLQKWDAHAPW